MSKLFRKRSANVPSVMVAEGLTGRLFDVAKNTPGQATTGILLGEESGDAIYVTRFYPGISDPNPKSIQHTIMHDLVPKVLDAKGHKQIEESIVGWYRSELSNRPLSASISREDVETQASFQDEKNAPMSVMMLLDAEKREARLYRVTSNGGIMEVQGRKVPATPIRETVTPVFTPPIPPPPPQVAEPIIEAVPQVVARKVPEIIPSAPRQEVSTSQSEPVESVAPIEPLTESSHQTAPEIIPSAPKGFQTIEPAVNIAVRCPNCAYENASDASFCSKCGASLTPAPPLRLVTSPSPRSLVVSPQQPQFFPTPKEEVRTPMVSRPQILPTRINRRVLIGFVLLIILFSSILGGVVLYYAGYRLFPSTLQISHSPPGGLLIGNSVSFTATVTGSGIQNVILTYRILQRAQGPQDFIFADPIQVAMSPASQGSNTYSGQIYGSQLYGSYLSYEISATDSGGNTVHTATYDLPIADYDWHLSQTSEVTVIRGIATQVTLPQLDALNGFNQPVTVKVAGSTPAGVSIQASTAQVNVPSTSVLQITSTSDSQLAQKYSVEVDAVYVPSGDTSVQVTRALNLILTVTDFAITVTPSYVKLLTLAGSTAIYSATLETYAGFVAPNGLNITVTGLPAKVTWQLVLTKYGVDSTNNVIANYNLVVTAQTGVAVGSYTLDFRVVASTPQGTVIHDVNNLQLQVATS